MRSINSLIAAILFISFMNSGFSQNINWRSFKETQRHAVNINAGLDYSLSFGAGYGYKLKTELPVMLNLEYSFPSGKNLFDDFKTKIGGQAEVAKFGNFSATLKVHGIFRRFQNDLSRFAGFGSEISGTIGYYRPKWYVAGDLAFDKAIVTHIRHSDFAEENYPDIQGGWYIPTGGNFLYGLQTGFSVKKCDLYLKAGKIVTQDFKTTPLLPFYFNLGLNRRF